MRLAEALDSDADALLVPDADAVGTVLKDGSSDDVRGISTWLELDSTFELVVGSTVLEVVVVGGSEVDGPTEISGGSLDIPPAVEVAVFCEVGEGVVSDSELVAEVVAADLVDVGSGVEVDVSPPATQSNRPSQVEVGLVVVSVSEEVAAFVVEGSPFVLVGSTDADLVVVGSSLVLVGSKLDVLLVDSVSVAVNVGVALDDDDDDLSPISTREPSSPKIEPPRICLFR